MHYDLRKVQHKLYPGRLEHPIFVSENSKIRIGAIAFDPVNFAATSDGRLFGNFFELYSRKMYPVIKKIENRLRAAEKKDKMKDIQFYRGKLDYARHMHEIEKINFFEFVIQGLFSSYDIIITESIDSLQNIEGKFSARGGDYPLKNIIYKPYFKEFVTGLMMYANAHGLSKTIIPVRNGIFQEAHNTCYCCGTYYQTLQYNSDCQWKCTKCGYIHHESVNSAVNFRHRCFDRIMFEAGLPIRYQDTISEGDKNNENRN